MGALLKQMYTGKYELSLANAWWTNIQEFTWNMYHSGGSSNPVIITKKVDIKILKQKNF